MGILNSFRKRNRFKKLAQSYGGDPADYQRMVKNVESSLEKVTEQLNATGIPSVMWNDAMKDIVTNSELGNLFSNTLWTGEDMSELEEAATEFVNEMLKRYSDQWQVEEGMPEELFGSLMKPFYQQELPVAPEEDVAEGTYIPGVDYSLIEKLILSWDQEIDPKLMAETEKYTQEAKANFENQASAMNELMRQIQTHPKRDEIINWLTHDMNAALQNQYGYNKDYRSILKNFTAANMPAIMTAMYMTGMIDTYDFSYRLSSLADYWKNQIGSMY